MVLHEAVLMVLVEAVLVEALLVGATLYTYYNKIIRTPSVQIM